MVTKKKTLKDWIIFLVIVLIIVGGSLYYVYFFTPKNSLELYEELTFAANFEDVQKLLLDRYVYWCQARPETIISTSARHQTMITSLKGV